MLNHAAYMRVALAEAKTAYEMGEVPIGAIVVCRGHIIGKGHNLVEHLKDPTAHAEMIALTAATNTLGTKRLHQATIYVTIEPCSMCASALRWAMLQTIVFGAHEPKYGFTRFQPSLIHPKTTVIPGILANEARELMQSFFKARR
jgi:tRNA(adenine34) deaminase